MQAAFIIAQPCPTKNNSLMGSIEKCLDIQQLKNLVDSTPTSWDIIIQVKTRDTHKDSLFFRRIGRCFNFLQMTWSP